MNENKKLYGLYLAYHKRDVLPDEECENPEIPNYPASIACVRCYETKFEQIEAYANTMCPASQVFEAESREEFEEKVLELNKNFENEAWLEKFIYPYL